MDRGTLFRSIALGIALVNQLLIQFGTGILIAGDHEYWYHIISTILTAVIAIMDMVQK